MTTHIQDQINGRRKQNPVVHATFVCACGTYFMSDGMGDPRCPKCRNDPRARQNHVMQMAIYRRRWPDVIREQLKELYQAKRLAKGAVVKKEEGRQVIIAWQSNSYTFYVGKK